MNLCASTESLVLTRRPFSVLFSRFTGSAKVKVHTTLPEDRLYHETTVQFNSFVGSGQEYEGAYCVLFRHDLTDEQYREFIAALRIMADEGVGGQRSSGKEQFREVREVTIDIPEGRGCSVFGVVDCFTRR